MQLQAPNAGEHNKVVLRNVASSFLTRTLLGIMYLLSVPYIVHRLGVEAYAILSLSMVLIGYLAILDLGLGKGMVKYLAEYIGSQAKDQIPKLVGTGLVLYCLLGAVGCLLLAGATSLLVEHLFHIPLPLRHTAEFAFYITAIGVALTFPQIFFASIPTGCQEIHRLNNISLATNTFRVLASVAAVALGCSLLAVVSVNVVATAFQLGALCAVSLKMLPAGALRPRFDAAMARVICGFSLKAGVADLMGMVTAHLDKFMIAMFLPVANLSFYTIPFDLASRIWEVPRNVVTSAFPAFSVLHGQDKSEELLKLYLRVSKYIVIGAAFLSCFVVVFANSILTVWVGGEFAREGALILRIFAISVFLSSSVYASFTLANGTGHADIPAKVHLTMAGLNVVLCLALIPSLGLLGAALAWALQHVLDVSLMVPWVNARVLRLSNLAYFRECYVWPLIFSILTVGASGWLSHAVAPGFRQLVLHFCLAGLAYATLTYLWVLDRNERYFIKTVLQRRFASSV